MASQIKVNTYLSSECALACASTQYGEIEIAPSAEQLAALSEEDRQLLPKYLALPGPSRTQLSVPRPGWDGVLHALAEVRAAAAKKQADLRANIAYECDSYRRMNSMVRAGTYFEKDVFPPREVSLPDLWTSPPNYGKGDPECQALWKEHQDLVREAVAELIRIADSKLEGVEGTLLGEGEGTRPSELVITIRDRGKTSKVPTPNASRIVQLANEIAQAAEQIRLEREQAEDRLLVEKYGTAEQLERFEAGVLPDIEFEALADLYLFGSLRKLECFQPYVTLTTEEVAEALDCEEEAVKFLSREYDDGPLTGPEYARLKTMRAQAPSDAIIEVRQHVGYDRRRSETDDPEVTRLSVRLTRRLGGRKFTALFRL